jgi:diguanylate cyclase (GGDEF)-like protein
VHLQQAITRVERTGQAASLMYIDLDRFKPVNDTWGHLAGDAVLWAVASVLRHGVRDSDVVARLGGDEFAVILSGCTPRRAARIGGELLHTLASLSIPWDQDRLRVGASIGIAPLAGGMSVDQAVARPMPSATGPRRWAATTCRCRASCPTCRARTVRPAEPARTAGADEGCFICPRRLIWRAWASLDFSGAHVARIDHRG